MLTFSKLKTYFSVKLVRLSIPFFVVDICYIDSEIKEVDFMGGYGGGYGNNFALIVVLFILLIIVGTAYVGGF